MLQTLWSSAFIYWFIVTVYFAVKDNEFISMLLSVLVKIFYTESSK